MTPNIEHLFQQALDAQVNGKLRDAERLYQTILELRPQHSHASHNLGVLTYALNRPEDSLILFKAALEANPNEGQFWVSYIEALSRLGHVDLARQILDQGQKLGLAGADIDELARRLSAAGHSLNQDLNALLEFYNNGQNDIAEQRALSILEHSPNHPFCWKLLGALYKRTGRLDESLAANKEAVNANMKDEEAHNNLGGTLQEVGQLDDAVASFKNAIALKPDYPEPYYNLGITLKQFGKRVTAQASYRKAIRLRPHYVEAYNNLGIILHETGRFAEASNIYKLLLTLAPDYAPAYFNLGVTQREQGQFENAETIFNHTLVLDANYPGACVCLGMVLVASNKLSAALHLAISLNGDKPTIESKNLFVGLSQKIIPMTWDTSLANLAIMALLEPWGRPSDLMPFACRLLKTNTEFVSISNQISRELDSECMEQNLLQMLTKMNSSSLALLSAMLTASPIADLELEMFLTSLRRQVLRRAASPNSTAADVDHLTALFCALASQCFINEYVYFEMIEERSISRQLRDRLIQAIEKDRTIPDLLVIVVSCYFPLYSIDGAINLLKRNWSMDIRRVLTQQIKEPIDERDLHTSIPNLTKIEDRVSVSVKTLYEENPYPRWLRIERNRHKQNLNSYIQSRLQDVAFHRFTADRDIDVLCAGCGTGQDPIETALSLADAKILAIDLSIESLGYAKRKSLEVGIDSIEFNRADILNLATIGREFDLIESMGVLHHLENPFQGWEVLLSLLRPHGVMRLGFYSELARRDIVRVRKLVEEQGIGSSFEDIRNFRRRLLDLNGIENFGFAMSSSDFFSTSACRDLLFHIQEHRMDLNMIGGFLESHELDFLGFDIDRAVIDAYRRRFPNDFFATNLKNWHVFEEENPDTFVGMYQFFIQKNKLA